MQGSAIKPSPEIMQTIHERKSTDTGSEFSKKLPLNAVKFECRKARFANQRKPCAGRERYMSRALVLNATYEPLGVVTDRRALILVLNNRATVVENSSEILHFASGEIALPAVIRLNKFVRILIDMRFHFLASRNFCT
jgi:hypothetical protein